MSALTHGAARIRTLEFERTGSRRKWLNTLFAVLIYTGLVTCCALLAYWRMFGTWATFDDEGFFVYSLKAFVDGHALYSSVYSEFGPFFYLLFGAFFKLTGIAVTEDAGRFVTLSLWVLTSFGFGLVTHRFTHSLWAGVTAMLGTYPLIGVVTSASMHPQILVCALTAACAGVILLWLPRSDRAAPATLGSLLAAMALTKINLGGFAVIGIGFATVFAGPVVLRRRWLLVLAAGVFTLLGPAVMKADWSLPSAQHYSATVALSVLALAITAWPSHELQDEQAPRSAFTYWLVGGFVVSALVMLALIVALGSTLGTWFLDTITIPSRQSIFANYPLALNILDVKMGVASVVVATLVRCRHRVFGDRVRVPLKVVGATRFLAGMAIIWPALDLLQFQTWVLPSYVLAWPLIWLVASPPADGRQVTNRLPRVALVAFAISQSLGAYPFAASEGPLSGLTLVVCGSICLGDGVSQMRSATADRRRGLGVAVIGTGVIAAIASWGFYRDVVLQFGSAKGTYWAFSAPINGIGGSRIRIANPWHMQVNSVLAKLRNLHCGALMEIPGLYSFNLWTDVPTPSYLNGQQPYWSSLTSGQQNQVLAQARRSRDLCVLTDYSVAALYLVPGTTVPKVPLIRYLEDDFKTVATYGPYTVRVRRSVPSAPPVKHTLKTARRPPAAA